MSSIAINPFQGINYVQVSQAQNAAQQAVTNIVASTGGGIIRQATNQTNVAVAQTGQSDAGRNTRARESGSRSSDGATTRLEGEIQANAGARGGRRPGSQLNILV